MSSFEIVAPQVAVRAARFRHRTHDSIGEYGPSLRYVLVSGDWTGQGWTGLETQGLCDFGQAPPLTHDATAMEWWRQVWDAQCYRQFTPAVALKLLDISANMASPHQAMIILNRALRGAGYPLTNDGAPVGPQTMAAIRNLQMRDQEGALLAAMRSEQAALYRAAACDGAVGYRLNGWLNHAYA